MKFQKGHKKIGGRGAGVPNKKTTQWEMFVEYSLEGGLTKFRKELNTLKGKEYVSAYMNLLEFVKPKLARTETDITTLGEKTNTPDLSHLTYEQLKELAYGYMKGQPKPLIIDDINDDPTLQREKALLTLSKETTNII